MIRSLTLLTCFLVLAGSLRAEKKKEIAKDPYAFYSGDTVIYYFNSDWRLIDQPNNASGWRKAWPGLMDRYVFIEQFTNGNIRVAGVSYGPQPEAKLEEEYKRYSIDGVLLEDKYYKFGKLDGEAKDFYENGELEWVRTYDEGTLTGWSRNYYEDGQLESEAQYVDGKKEGMYFSFHESGAKEVVANYLEGKLNGTYSRYYSNGQLEYQTEYVDGEQVGTTVYLSEDGSRYRTLVIEDGERQRDTYYHADSTIRVDYNYVDGELQGKVIERNHLGNIVRDAEYVAGIIVGDEYYYDPSGATLLKHYRYVEGKYEGEQTTYYQDGSIKTLQIYADGELAQDLAYDRSGKEFYAKNVVKAPKPIGFKLPNPPGFGRIEDDHRGSGRAIIECHVDPSGKVSNVKLVESANDYFDTLLIHVLEEMKFAPGSYFNRPTGMMIMFSIKVSANDWTWEMGYPYDLDNPENMKTEDSIYTSVENPPSFRGGDAELFKYLGTSTIYPEVAKDMGEQGVVYINFIVTKSGIVRGAKILRGVHWSLDREALRVVNLMPVWEPGTQRGKPVPVSYNLPIRFILR